MRFLTRDLKQDILLRGCWDYDGKGICRGEVSVAVESDLGVYGVCPFHYLQNYSDLPVVPLRELLRETWDSARRSDEYTNPWN